MAPLLSERGQAGGCGVSQPSTPDLVTWQRGLSSSCQESPLALLPVAGSHPEPGVMAGYDVTPELPAVVGVPQTPRLYLF